ncbi:hypothetical protein J3D54_004204 [Pseudomonas sp. GGS8]|nr:hypothetical protein [Pseudomonas sp. GGS8]
MELFLTTVLIRIQRVVPMTYMAHMGLSSSTFRGEQEWGSIQEERIAAHKTIRRWEVSERQTRLWDSCVIS